MELLGTMEMYQKYSNFLKMFFLINISEKSQERLILPKNRIKSLKKFGSVGIFCPARALYFIHETQGLRFFDDADFLCGKFYPPFPIKIENRLSLKENPPEILIIFSYTYGQEIRAAIRELFRDSEMSPMILTQEEFFDVSKNFP